MARIREGTVIADKYRIERPLARGGMGTIWVARHMPLDMPVAVKFMEANFAETAEGRSRFEREARAVALIQSPHIVHIHDYGVHDDVPYIAMELLRGEDFGARIRREGRLPLAFVAEVVVQLCKALRKAHDAGIIHRDLKPANVFLAKDDDEQIVKILDFGVAKMIGPGEAGEATRTGVVVGSVHYMSPEQARGSKDIDARSDLWSVGVIAFRALTGHLPFPGDQMGDVIVKICTEPIPSVASFRPDLGPEVDAFFTRAFGRRPDERFATARELAQAFAALAGGSGSELSSAGIPLRAMASAISSSGAIDGRASTVPTGGTPPPPQRDAVTMTGSDLHTSATASGPVSTGSPLALGLRVSDPPATPPVAPIYPAPPASTGTFSTGSQISDVSPALPARPAPRRTVLVAAVAGAVALAIGGLVMFGGGRAAPVATGGAASPVAPTAPPPVTAAAASVTAAAPSVTAAPTLSSTPTAAPSATGTASASATASAAAPRAAPPKAPRGGAPAKDINSELGF